MKTSEIEGERLDANQVRFSLARRLGVDIGAPQPADQQVEGAGGDDVGRYRQLRGAAYGGPAQGLAGGIVSRGPKRTVPHPYRGLAGRRAGADDAGGVGVGCVASGPTVKCCEGPRPGELSRQAAQNRSGIRLPAADLVPLRGEFQSSAGACRLSWAIRFRGPKTYVESIAQALGECEPSKVKFSMRIVGVASQALPSSPSIGLP